MAALKIIDADFEEKVLKSDVPVLVDFWAEWCGPCQMAGPILDELADEYKDKVVVAKLNIDENQESPMKYQVMSIPTVVLFKGGEEVDRKIGYGGKQGYVDLIEMAVR